MSVDAARRSPAASTLTPDQAWSLVRALRARVDNRGPFTEDIGILLNNGGGLAECKPDDGAIALRVAQASGWSTAGATLEPEAARILDLYVPLCVAANASSLVVGHLAQTLDGRVATNSGASQFISGQADLVHTHRLRALFDAVIVGAGTAQLDDPQLTTRRAEGSNPTRVVLDGRGRLKPDRRVFSDGSAPTLLVRGRGAPPFAAGPLTEVVEVDVDDGWMAIPAVVAALADRGLRRLFIEGGGVTVSRFIRAKAMDRLHITVAPVLFGSGRPAIVLPEIESLQDAIALECRHVPMGPDMLFDCPLPR